jgi:hypothetical protein
VDRPDTRGRCHCELYGRPGDCQDGIALNVAEIARLAQVFTKLTGAVAAAAASQQPA